MDVEKVGVEIEKKHHACRPPFRIAIFTGYASFKFTNNRSVRSGAIQTFLLVKISIISHLTSLNDEVYAPDNRKYNASQQTERQARFGKNIKNKFRLLKSCWSNCEKR